MATVYQVNCSIPSSESPPSSLQPNSDIAGIGVIISFVFTAYFTFILVLVHYIFDCSEEPDRNPIDRGITKFVRGCIRLKCSNWGPAIVKGVLMYSDQQLITGIAILGAGYSQLPYGLPAYYWQFVLQLAWFSSITHLTTLTLLRCYFWQNLAARCWRVSLMILLAVLQVVGLIPTSWAAWPLNFPPIGKSWPGPVVPAQCYFTREYFSGSSTWQIGSLSLAITLIYLISSYITRLVELSKRTSLLCRTWLRLKPGGLFKRFIEKLHDHRCRSSTKSIWRILYRTSLIIFALLRATMDILESILWEIIWLFSALALGMVKLFQLSVAAAGTLTSAAASGNSVSSFGQWLPLLLLTLPILSMAETIWETRDESPHHLNTTPNPMSCSTVQHEPIAHEDSVAQAWPEDSYRQAWFRWLVALIVLSCIATIIIILVAFGTQRTGVWPLGPLLVNKSNCSLYLLTGIVLYTSLFVFLEGLRLQGLLERFLMSVLPGILVIAICVYVLVWTLFEGGDASVISLSGVGEN